MLYCWDLSATVVNKNKLKKIKKENNRKNLFTEKKICFQVLTSDEFGVLTISYEDFFGWSFIFGREEVQSSHVSTYLDSLFSD